MRPTTAGAYNDDPPIYHNDCHAIRAAKVAKPCSYGSARAANRVLFFGDSHMAQWWAPMVTAARQNGWRADWLTKTSCPAPAVDVRQWRSTSPYKACNAWRASALRRVERGPKYKLIVVSSYDFHQIVKPNNKVMRGAARTAAWRAGVTKTLAVLSAHADRVLWVRDTPRQRVDVPRCIAKHRANYGKKCATRRAWALPNTLWNVERAAAAVLPNVSTVDFANSICGVRECLPVVGGVLRWRDDSHITMTFSRQLTPIVKAELLKAAQPEPPDAQPPRARSGH